ncbi:unnamed protein product [Gordionus sp. m RMFG-2023]
MWILHCQTYLEDQRRGFNNKAGDEQIERRLIVVLKDINIENKNVKRKKIDSLNNEESIVNDMIVNNVSTEGKKIG